MRSPQYKSSRRYGFNMTPMIDVVFLLIIFFLVSSHLARQETQMELELPIALMGDLDESIESPKVTINVKADGTLWVAGALVRKEQLSARLKTQMTEDGDNLEVRIRGSREAPYSSVEPIMLACTQAGIWNVSYAVYGENSR